MISAVNHVQITVPKDAEDQARSFYCGLLGLLELEKPKELKSNGGFWLNLGSIQLHIGLEEFPYRKETKAHVAFEINSEKLLRKLLKDNDIEVIENTQIKGFKRFDIRDPFGNRIEFMERI